MWRERRGMTLGDLGAIVQVHSARLAALEEGHDWVPSRRLLATLAMALRLDPAELSGQPYPPTGNEHAEILEGIFRLRRQLAGTVETPRTESSTEPGELAARVSELVRAERAGDEHALAAAAPEALTITKHAADAARAEAPDDTARLRAEAHAVVAGLLRRLGYKDLCWSFLHRVGDAEADQPAVHMEEVRLLLDLGLAEHAAARAARDRGAEALTDFLRLSVLAHAMSGSRTLAEQTLSRVASYATSLPDHARTTMTRAVVAAELGEFDEAADHARHVDIAALAPTDAVELLVTAATATARQGDAATAASFLCDAEAMAPLRFRLDPLARDLLAVLPAHANEPGVATAVRQLATRAGVG